MKAQKKNTDNISKLEATIERYLKEVTVHLLHGRYDVATSIGLSAFEMAQSINDKTRMARASCALSRAAVELKKYDLCLEYCNTAKNLAIELEHPMLLGHVYQQLAIMYYALKQFSKSMEYQQLSYTIHREINNFPGVIAAMLMIADINAWMGNIPKALEIAIQSIQLQIDTEDFYQIVPTHILVGTLYTNVHKYEDALSHFTQALELAADNPRQLQNIYSNIADLYNHTKEHNKAVYYCNTAIEIIEKNNLPKSTSAYPKFLAAIAYIQLEEYDSALPIAESLLEQAAIDKSLDNERNALECLIKIYQAKGMYPSALTASKQFYACLEKMFNTQSTNTVNQLTTMFELNSIQFTIEREQLTSEALRKHIIRANKELTTLALTIAQKNEMALTLFVQVQETIKSIKGKESYNTLLQIKNELLSELDTEKSWGEFNTRFTSVHNNFLQTLQLSFPKLNQTEQIICALIKINLSTKEISNFLCIPLNTIEVTRKRLRKKLQLDSGINLTTFLSSL